VIEERFRSELDDSRHELGFGVGLESVEEAVSASLPLIATIEAELLKYGE
jgi:hypothetical protein